MARRLFIVFAALAAGASLVGAQQSATFHAANNTVSVYATVVDASGRLVPNLAKDDFTVYDNGKPQTLTLFKNDIQPITIVIMLDRSGSMMSNFGLVRDAAEAFVTTLLPDDKARLGSFSNRVQIDPPEFTSDPKVLVEILHNNLQEAGPTPLWNATGAAMTALGKEPGRKVVLVFTDGIDSPGRPGRNLTLAEVGDRSQAEEVMIYAIGLANPCGEPSANLSAVVPAGVWAQGRGPSGGGRGGPGGGQGGGRNPGGAGGGGRGPGGRGPGIGGRVPMPIGRGPIPLGPIALPGTDAVGGRGGDGPGSGNGGGLMISRGACAPSRPDPGLKTLADEGGGGYFELHGTDDLAATFARVAEELHHQYLLAFTAPALDGKVHKLEVRLRSSEMTARSRKSYVAASDK